MSARWLALVDLDRQQVLVMFGQGGILGAHEGGRGGSILEGSGPYAGRWVQQNIDHIAALLATAPAPEETP